MRTIVFTLLAVLLISVSVNAEKDILEKQLEIRQASLDTLTYTLEVGMDASIGYVRELGGSTSEIESLKNDFIAKRGSIRDAKDHATLDAGIAEMGNTLKSFNSKADAEIKANKGNGITLLAKVVAAAKEKESEINELKDKYWDTKHENLLAIFDEQMDIIRDVARFISDSGWDMARIYSKINQIEDLRNDLDKALSSKNELEVGKVQLKIIAAGSELITIGAPALDWAYNAQGIKFWLDVASTALNSIDNLLGELEKLNIDVSELRTIYDRATKDLEDLQKAYDSMNTAQARAALGNLGKDWQDFITKLNKIMPKIQADMQQQLQGIISALQNSHQQLLQDVRNIK